MLELWGNADVKGVVEQTDLPLRAGGVLYRTGAALAGQAAAETPERDFSKLPTSHSQKRLLPVVDQLSL